VEGYRRRKLKDSFGCINANLLLPRLKLFVLLLLLSCRGFVEGYRRRKLTNSLDDMFVTSLLLPMDVEAACAAAVGVLQGFCGGL
jgi:hypothetical protein